VKVPSTGIYIRLSLYQEVVELKELSYCPH
jgi:hypothetical protein